MNCPALARFEAECESKRVESYSWIATSRSRIESELYDRGGRATYIDVEFTQVWSRTMMK